jgi:transcriptional regulator with XRE-family HTH domain
MVRETLGQRVQLRRLQLHLTTTGLAERARVSLVIVQEIEQGIITWPAPNVLLQLAEALEVSPDWLRTGKGPTIRYSS